MRLKITPDGGGQLRWAMVASREVSEPLASGVRSYPDVSACCRAAAEMLAASPGDMMAIQLPEGGWRWSIRGQDGEPLALSSSTFDNAAACGYALHNLRRSWLRPAA